MITKHPPRFASILMVLASTAPVFAQTAPDATARRRLVEQAIAARDAGQHAQALDLFEQAGRIQMRPGLRMSIAEEQQAMGHAIEACEAATACVTEAQANLTGTGNAAALQGCASLVATTCSALGHVRLRLPATLPEGLRLTVQGRVIDRPTGEPLAVSPGTVTVQAIAGRQVLFEEAVAVQRGETRDVAVRFDAEAPAPAPTLAPVGVDLSPPVTPTASVAVPVPAAHAGSAGRRVGPWLVLASGVVGLGLSALFLGLREAAKSSRDDACGMGYCPPAAQDFQTTAETDNLAMYVTLGVGAAAATAGVIWLVAGRRSEASMVRTGWHLHLAPTHGGALVGVGGSL